MHWLFNSEKFPISGQTEETITWLQKRSFNGKTGEQVIFYQFNETAKTFTYLYSITSVDIESVKSLQKEESSNAGYKITVKLGLETELVPKEKEIVDYIYSFIRIKNFGSKLYRHFRGRYYRISRQEFVAITEDQIYEARTLLGTALSALHPEHRNAFGLLLVERYPEVLQNRYNHQDTLQLLYEYLNYAVITPARQLTAAYGYLEGIVNDTTILNDIGFTDAETPGNKTDNIAAQVAVINDYIESYIKVSSSGDTSILTEITFEKVFANKPLPINLTEK